jgi:uncharacterized integral membrane protein (TIGR00698 family)
MTVMETRPTVVPDPVTEQDVTSSRRATPRSLDAGIGMAVAALGLGAAVLGHLLVPQVGILTWAIGLGVAAANLGVLPQTAASQLGLVTKKLLRVGIVLLGFSVSFASITALGLPLIAVVAGSLVGTLVFTTWLGRRVGLSAPRALLIGTGFSICGASAIAGMEDTAGADEEDVTVSIAMVTLFGTLALVLLPLLQGPLGLTDLQFGMWAGASVHEVGQVVAAASPAGAAVVAVAVVVKLTRVVMLAPVVAAVSIMQRMGSSAGSAGKGRTALVPLFVLGFLACVALRSTGVVPASALDWIGHVQVAALGAALFGMGCSVKIASLLKGSGAVMVVSAVGTLFIGVTSLAGILLVTGHWA